MADGEVPKKRFSSTIDVNHSLCTGCRNCEIVCSIRHEGTVFAAASRIKVYQFEDGPVDVPVFCHRCSDYPCVAACPPKVGALSVDQVTGAVKVDTQKCVGVKCSKCAKACRHRTAIFFHPVTKKPLLCDVCEGDPECVKVCPTASLELMPASTFNGMHYAKMSPQEIAKSIATSFVPIRSDGTVSTGKEASK